MGLMYEDGKLVWDGEVGSPGAGLPGVSPVSDVQLNNRHDPKTGLVYRVVSGPNGLSPLGYPLQGIIPAPDGSGEYWAPYGEGGNFQYESGTGSGGSALGQALNAGAGVFGLAGGAIGLMGAAGAAGLGASDVASGFDALTTGEVAGNFAGGTMTDANLASLVRSGQDAYTGGIGVGEGLGTGTWNPVVNGGLNLPEGVGTQVAAANDLSVAGAAPGVTISPYVPEAGSLAGVTGTALPAAAGGALGSTLGNLVTPQSVAQSAASQMVQQAASDGTQMPPSTPVGNNPNTAFDPTGTNSTGPSGDIGSALPGNPGSTGTGAITGAAGAAAGGSALSRIINGTATAADYLQLAGTAGTTIAGLAGADASRSANNAAADKMLALGAPARTEFNRTISPGFDPSSMPGYTGAIDSVMNSYLRKASTGGNPFSNPGVSMEANKYVTDSTALPAINNYRNSLTAAGGIGVGNANQPNVNAAGAVGGSTNAVAGGLGALTTQGAGANDFTTNIANLTKQLQQLGLA